MIDTIGFPADWSGLALNVPAGPRKHMVERLTLTEGGTRLRYEVSVEDPDFLTGPATLTQQWDHRPDLEFALGRAVRRWRLAIKAACRRSSV